VKRSAVKRTAGRWSREGSVYFIASNVDTLVHSHHCHTHLLCAINELRRPDDREAVVGFVNAGKSVLIDSGVFSLAMRHAEAHGMTMDQALAVAPADVDDFQPLFDSYCSLLREIGDQVWGYIEIDQGGRENKIKTRARLEEMGFRPIPVYHPLVDGWDYFDELARNYDRICFGNVVQAPPPLRKRLLATAWERQREYPRLWIHMLGLTPSEMCCAYPISSCDSSTWLAPVRWPTMVTRCCLKPFSEMPVDFRYAMEADDDAPEGHRKARKVCAYEAHHLMRNWRAVQADYAAAL
jgi:hypothetical protein